MKTPQTAPRLTALCFGLALCCGAAQAAPYTAANAPDAVSRAVLLAPLLRLDQG